jgi:hypothetical protein
MQVNVLRATLGSSVHLQGKARVAHVSHVVLENTVVLEQVLALSVQLELTIHLLLQVPVLRATLGSLAHLQGKALVAHVSHVVLENTAALVQVRARIVVFLRTVLAELLLA